MQACRDRSNTSLKFIYILTYNYILATIDLSFFQEKRDLCSNAKIHKEVLFVIGIQYPSKFNFFAVCSDTHLRKQVLWTCLYVRFLNGLIHVST